MMRRLIAIAAGSATYALVNVLTENMSFPGVQTVRPGIGVLVVFGVLFGPIVGFFVGLLGSTASDLVTFGFYWNWSLGNGLVGLLAGVSPSLVFRLKRRWLALIVVATVGALAIVVGASTTALTDVFVANLTLDTAITAEWIPLTILNLAWAMPLLVILLFVREVLRFRHGEPMKRV